MTFRAKDSIEVIVGAMSFEKPMSLALGPLPLWFLALWANFGCVVLTSIHGEINRCVSTDAASQLFEAEYLLMFRAYLVKHSAKYTP